jgi:hypothetical protein
MIYCVADFIRKNIIWKSNSDWKNRFVWFLEESCVLWDPLKIISSWILVNKFSWLSPWIPYYMQSATSGTIWTSAWSWTAFRIWIAVNEKSLFIWPQLSSYNI